MRGDSIEGASPSEEAADPLSHADSCGAASAAGAAARRSSIPPTTAAVATQRAVGCGHKIDEGKG